MSFQDPGQPDPSQPLTLPNPRVAQNLPPAYQPRQQDGPLQPFVPPASTFIPNVSNRDADMWGRDHGPITAYASYPGIRGDADIPSPAEAYSRAASTSGQLMRWGSDGVAERAGRVNQLAMGFAPLLDMISKGGFSKAFNRSALEGIKRQQEQLILESDQLQIEHAKQLTDYGAIFAKADALAAQYPDRAADFYEKARQELYQTAVQHQDQPLQNLLEQRGGIEAARGFIKQQDALFRDAWAANTSLKKAVGTDRDPDTASAWGLPSPSGTGGGVFAGPPTEGAPADPNRPTTQTPASSDYDQELMRKTSTRGNPTSQQEIDAARQLTMGQKPELYERLTKEPASQRTPFESRILAKIGQLQNMINHDVDQAANTPNPSNDPRVTQDRLDRLNKANPLMHETVTSIGTYDDDPDKLEKIGNRPYMEALVRKFFPDWKAGNYAVMKKYKDQNSVERKTLQAADRAIQPAINIFSDLKDMPENDSIPIARIRKAIADQVTNFGQYRALGNDIQQFITQLTAATSGQGVTRVTLFNKRLDEMPAFVSPRTLRLWIKREMSDIYAGAVGGFQNEYETALKRDDLAPGMTKNIWDSFSAILRHNDKTGEMPPRSPPALMAVSKKSTKGLKPEETLEPLSAADQRANSRNIAAIERNPDFHNPNSPNYANLHKVYEVLMLHEIPINTPPWAKQSMD